MLWPTPYLHLLIPWQVIHAFVQTSFPSRKKIKAFFPLDFTPLVRKKFRMYARCFSSSNCQNLCRQLIMSPLVIHLPLSRHFLAQQLVFNTLSMEAASQFFLTLAPSLSGLTCAHSNDKRRSYLGFGAMVLFGSEI